MKPFGKLLMHLFFLFVMYITVSTPFMTTGLSTDKTKHKIGKANRIGIFRWAQLITTIDLFTVSDSILPGGGRANTAQ